MDAVELALNILNIFRLAVQFIGHVLNILCSVICFWSTDLRGYPTFIFFGFIPIFNSLGSIGFGIDSLSEMVGTRISSYSTVFTILMFYIGYGASESSSWLLVAMTTERYLTMKIRGWRTLYFNSKRAIITTLIIIVTFYAFYTPFFTFKQTSISDSNTTDIRTAFYMDRLVQIWCAIHLFIYAIIPIMLLIIMNSLLINETLKTRKLVKSKQSSSKRISISITVALHTLFYIITNMPITILVIFGSIDFLYINAIGRILIAVFSTFQQIFSASSFITLYVTNVLFRQQTKKFLNILVSNEEDGKTMTTKTKK